MSEKLPARAEIEAAKKKLLLAHQELVTLQAAKETRAAKRRALEATLQQRAQTLAEREEARRARAIRHRINPEFLKQT